MVYIKKNTNHTRILSLTLFQANIFELKLCLSPKFSILLFFLRYKQATEIRVNCFVNKTWILFFFTHVPLSLNQILHFCYWQNYYWTHWIGLSWLPQVIMSKGRLCFAYQWFFFSPASCFQRVSNWSL